MEIRDSAEMKALRETTIGELIAVGSERRVLGVVLDGVGSDPLVGTLTPDEEPHPRLKRLWGSDACLSYGIDWLLDPIRGDESFPSRHEARRRTGLLVQLSGAWLMNFASSGIDGFGRFNFEWRNLADGTTVTPREASVLYSQWRIWISLEDRVDPHSAPLIEFTAEAPPTDSAA